MSDWPAKVDPARRAAVALAVLCAAWTALLAPPGDAAAPARRPTDLALRINPNSAGAAELQLLPRIGPGLAARIVAYRAHAAAPAFRTASDLDRVPGIGPITVSLVRPYLAFPADAAACESNP